MLLAGAGSSELTVASSRARHPPSVVSSISTEGSRVPRETATPQEIASVEVNAGSARSRVVDFPVPNGTASGVDALAFGDKIAVHVSYCCRLPLGCNSGLGVSRVGSHGSLPPPREPALVAHAVLLGSGWRRSTPHVPRTFANGFVVSGGSRLFGRLPATAMRRCGSGRLPARPHLGALSWSRSPGG